MASLCMCVCDFEQMCTIHTELNEIKMKKKLKSKMKEKKTPLTLKETESSLRPQTRYFFAYQTLKHENSPLSLLSLACF